MRSYFDNRVGFTLLSFLSVALAVNAFAANPCASSATTINDPTTTAWASRLIAALGEDSACQAQRADDDQGTFSVNTPCNIFAGRVLERVYATKDFYVTPPQPDKPFYRANEIATLLQAGVWPKWRDLGTGDEQDVLNDAKKAGDAGKLVIAVWRNPNATAPGHIALIGPGPLRHSSSWDADVPAAASLTLGNPNAGFLGKPLSCAFGGDKSDAVHIWVRDN